MPDALAILEARLAELERVHAVGDADRTILFPEVCDSIRRADSTVRRWLASPALRKKYALETLFVRDVSGRLTSTPRKLVAWRRAMAAQWGQGARP